MLIHVYPTINVAVNVPVEIWISPIVNSLNVLVAGVTVKVLRFCSGEELCTMYQGRGWYKTTSSLIVTDYATTVATFTPSPTTVLKPLSTHSYTFSPNNMLTTFINYP